ncbi:trehalose-phosphatase [Salinimicrobium xinjiangense]|uniref:trehalose-phosphatase n=1 Tax=Salinimicrobium xinjiangense TaxID=438596 RepID=UPI0003FA90D9|nr:trehalose-phosphatase [Salinimicrobium xinjiangense]
MKYLIKAAITDLDGVITQTAGQHKKAWKKTFDGYNERRKKEGKESFLPFTDEDYARHIDGIPRYDGVKNFLASRGLDLPFGSPKDQPDRESVCGIGNLKNLVFGKVVAEEGVQVNQKNVEQLRAWKEQGIRIGLISSSRNCRKILRIAGLENGLFDTVVDGNTSAERNFPGKPAPDIFLEAAKELQVKPKEALIIEDALAGVEAGKNGNFRLVIGIENASSKEELLEHGAQFAVKNLQELEIEFKRGREAAELPSALEHFSEISKKHLQKKPLLFLDFDGTLAPIVEHHADAAISEEMRELVKRLAEIYPVAVISGRGMADVKKRLKLPGIYYAGSHGYEISGPNGFFRENEEAQKVLPFFNEIEPLMREKLKEIEGVDFERKKFTLAIHYRQVKPEQEQEVRKTVSNVLKDYSELAGAGGKKVIEIRPNIDWHKGKAVEFLKSVISEEEEPFSIYVGDDVTDEDAFREVEHGLGILVGEHSQNTYADYSLQDLEDVKIFFRKLISREGT